MVWNAEFSYTDASRNVDQFVLYDPIDDNNIQAVRRRLDFEDYGNIFPNPPFPGPANVFAVNPKFDERFYAVRRGIMPGRRDIEPSRRVERAG